MSKQRIELTGRNLEEIDSLGADEARDLFLSKFFTALCKILYPDKSDYLDGDIERWMTIPGANQLWSRFKEIVKNIHDHNGGWGYAEFEVLQDDEVHFIVGNLDNPTSETNEHKPETQVNYGIGSNYIALLGIKNIDPSGYIYQGTFKIPH